MKLKFSMEDWEDNTLREFYFAFFKIYWDRSLFCTNRKRYGITILGFDIWLEIKKEEKDGKRKKN